MKLLRTLVATLTWGSAAVTILSLVRHPHWIFRVWDFPRVQIASIAVLGTAVWQTFFTRQKLHDRAMTGAALTAAAFHAWRIIPYTPLTAVQSHQAVNPDPVTVVSVLISNVLTPNRQYQRLLETVRTTDPDIILAVETDASWADALRELFDEFPYRILHPLDNLYGMALLSKLELVDPEVRFLVQEDIPSVRTGVRLRSGEIARFYGIHPRPPEPMRGQRSSSRDAELVLVGKEIEKNPDLPAIVSGDLNDVAWSETSELFVRISGLLDPRRGRGFYNSYNANNPLFRFPLDHVFHSKHFKVISLERLPHIGSDHFPILIRLAFDEEAAGEQSAPSKHRGDDAQAAERLEKQREDAANGEDRPDDE
jgi:endonuclease/exonuclease/phosphatase (EEP) superfamily protein YafD